MARHVHTTPTFTTRKRPVAIASREWTEYAIATLIDYLDSLDAGTDDLEPDDDGEDTDCSRINGWIL